MTDGWIFRSFNVLMPCAKYILTLCSPRVCGSSYSSVAHRTFSLVSSAKSTTANLSKGRGGGSKDGGRGLCLTKFFLEPWFPPDEVSDEGSGGKFSSDGSAA
jgi:hypothetical protein